MGLHFASFVSVYTFLEPRKRQALTDAVSAMLQQHTATIDARLGQLMGARPAVAAHVASGSREQAADSRQRQQQQDGGSQSVGTEVQEEQQQRVLQELEKVQQQLKALAQTQQQQQQVSSATQPGRS